MGKKKLTGEMQWKPEDRFATYNYDKNQWEDDLGNYSNYDDYYDYCEDWTVCDCCGYAEGSDWTSTEEGIICNSCTTALWNKWQNGEIATETFEEALEVALVTAKLMR